MPVYHFTYHAYLSWLPDRPQGYVHHKTGLQSSSPDLADRYRQEANHEEVVFDKTHQVLLIDEIRAASEHQDFEPVAIGTDASHLHLLLQWRDDRPWKVLRSGIKSSLSRKLNQEFGKRPWFVENASRKRVDDTKHYKHLRYTYIPDHGGWKWDAKRGRYR